jgi:hypothetical protein
MVLIYGEARGYSELVRQIYRERFPERILPNARNLCKRCAASSRFWVLRNKEARSWPPTRRSHFSCRT